MDEIFAKINEILDWIKSFIEKIFGIVNDSTTEA